MSQIDRNSIRGICDQFIIRLVLNRFLCGVLLGESIACDDNNAGEVGHSKCSSSSSCCSGCSFFLARLNAAFCGVTHGVLQVGQT